MAWKFGTKQLGNPTPANFDRNVKIFVGVTGLFLAWMPTNNIIGHGLQDVITPLINLANSVLIFLLPFFGVQTSAKKVSIDDVQTMEQPEKKD